MNTSKRINGIAHVEQALRTLEAYDYDTSALWAEHNAWLRTLDAREPTAFDMQWATRNDKPSSIDEHFVKNLKFPVYADDKRPGDAPIGWRTEKVYEPEILSAANAFVDRQYTLTPGQRDVLRERHGLTPAKVVVVTHAELFPNTNIIWQLAIKSAEHIDPRRRKHVLVEAVMTPASEFFQLSAARDAEREAARELADEQRVKEGKKPVSVRARALVYME